MPPKRKGGGSSGGSGTNGLLGRLLVKKAAQDRRKPKDAGTGFYAADVAASNNPLQSITELSSLEDFVSSAVLAERTFEAERVNMRFVDTGVGAGAAVAAGRLSKERPATGGASVGGTGLVDSPSGVFKQLRIPRRPVWGESTTASELHTREKDAFLAWRRQVAALELEHGAGVAGAVEGHGSANITPFEKNLEVWRQLWRVVERADVLVQIVDGRNPLLFWCPDLVEYVHEVNEGKETLLLINKADYLRPRQRLAWARYFTKAGVPFLFFSAKREVLRLEAEDRARHAAAAAAMVSGGSGAVQPSAAAMGDPREVNTVGRQDLSALMAPAPPTDSAGADSTRGKAEGSMDAVPTRLPFAPPSIARTVNTAASASARAAAAATKREAALAAALREAFAGSGDDDSSTDSDSDVEAHAGKEMAPPALTPAPAPTPAPASAPTPVPVPSSIGHADDASHGGVSGDGEGAAAFMGTLGFEVDMSGIDPSDPLYAACRVLTRDELIDHLHQAYQHLPRGVLGGLGDELAKRRLAEMRARKRAEALAARNEELRRRQVMARRLIEAGLGSQVRFGDARDLASIALADGSTPAWKEEDTGVVGGDAEGMGGHGHGRDNGEVEAVGDEEEVPPLIIGMVGYPNVGKSSTINALLGATANNHHAKRVAVASTPGKTKHFQTLSLDHDITLMDAPGLVFPSFVATKEEMVVNGVLPIDQLRDHTGPMRLLCQRIPRATLEAQYGIRLPVPPPPQPPNRQPTIFELLDAYCKARGFMAAVHAGADHPRGARVLLKDYCDGRLLYCHPPPSGWLPASSTEGTSEEDLILPSADVDGPVTTLAPSAVIVKPGGGRVTMADNVLLPSAAARHHAPAAHPIPAPPAPGRDDSDGGHGASVQEGEVDDDVFGDEEEGEEIADDADLEALSEEVLRSFARKIVLPPPPSDDDDKDDDGEEEEEEEGDDGGEDVVGGGTSSTQAGISTTFMAAGGRVGGGGTITKLPKKMRGLVKARRLRKGEAHEADPYNTAAVADAATRRYMMMEIAAVTGGLPSGGLDGSGDMVGVGTASSSTRGMGGARAVGKRADTMGGAVRKDALPRHIRGMPTGVTLVATEERGAAGAGRRR